MSKQHHKIPQSVIAPITAGQLEEAARSLVRRGLASSLILDGDPDGDRFARRVAARRARRNGGSNDRP